MSKPFATEDLFATTTSRDQQSADRAVFHWTDLAGTKRRLIAIASGYDHDFAQYGRTCIRQNRATTAQRALQSL